MKQPRVIVVAIPFAAALLWGAAAGILGAQEEGGPEKKEPTVQLVPLAPPEPLVPTGPTPDLVILFTSEVEGFYQPCG